MSIQELIARPGAPEQDLVSSITAEAWMNPEFAEALRSDKIRAIVTFARDHGHAVPEGDWIDRFDLEPNPIGEIQFVGDPARMPAGATLECPTVACVTWTCSVAICPSAACPFTYGGCITVVCTVDTCMP